MPNLVPMEDDCNANASLFVPGRHPGQVEAMLDSEDAPARTIVEASGQRTTLASRSVCGSDCSLICAKIPRTSARPHRSPRFWKIGWRAAELFGQRCGTLAPTPLSETRCLGAVLTYANICSARMKRSVADETGAHG